MMSATRSCLTRQKRVRKLREIMDRNMLVFLRSLKTKLFNYFYVIFYKWESLSLGRRTEQKTREFTRDIELDNMEETMIRYSRTLSSLRSIRIEKRMRIYLVLGSSIVCLVHRILLISNLWRNIRQQRDIKEELRS